MSILTMFPVQAEEPTGPNITTEPADHSVTIECDCGNALDPVSLSSDPYGPYSSAKCDGCGSVYESFPYVRTQIFRDNKQIADI